jgi:hypothetical protein
MQRQVDFAMPICVSPVPCRIIQSRRWMRPDSDAKCSHFVITCDGELCFNIKSGKGKFIRDWGLDVKADFL